MHKKCNVPNHPETIPHSLPQIHGKIVFQETHPWCQKYCGPLPSSSPATSALLNVFGHQGDLEDSLRTDCWVGLPESLILGLVGSLRLFISNESPGEPAAASPGTTV